MIYLRDARNYHIHIYMHRPTVWILIYVWYSFKNQILPNLKIEIFEVLFKRFTLKSLKHFLNLLCRLYFFLSFVIWKIRAKKMIFHIFTCKKWWVITLDPVEKYHYQIILKLQIFTFKSLYKSACLSVSEFVCLNVP